MRIHGPVRGMVIVLLLATATFAAASRRQALQKLSIIPEVCADFGRGEKIMGAAVKAILLPQVQGMIANQREVTEEDIRNWTVTLVNSMIDQKLLLQEARKQGISVDFSQGQNLVFKQRRRLGDKTFEQMLALQGLDETQYAMRLAENLAVQQWIDQVIMPRQRVDAEEARAFYEANSEQFPEIAEYHVSHILLAVSLDTPYEELLKKQELGKKLREDLGQGGDFAKLAKQHSDCPTKADGGDLGFLAVGSMPEPFEEAVSELGPGEVSQVVRTPQGYHIVKAHAFKAAGTRPFAEVRQMIVADLEARKLDETMRNLTRQLRENANVRIYVEAP